MRRQLMLKILGATMLTPAAMGVASAQTTPPATTPSEQANTPAATPEDDTGPDIIIRAQRRDERNVEVPITVTSLSEKQLTTNSIRTIKDLNRVTSSLTVTHNGSKTQPAIRGINSRLGDNSVAIYVDGVYMPSDVALDSDFGPGVRVDVLKGPQGTLFGRNATGGAILITTLDPSFKPDVQISAGIEERKGYSGSFYGSIGLTDTIAVNFTASHRQTDGWVRRGDDPGGNTGIAIGTPINAQWHDLLRGKILWQPNPDFKVIAMFEHGASYDASGFGRALLAYTGAIAPRPPVIRNIAFQSFAPDNRAYWESASIRVVADMGNTTFTSITGFRDERTSILLDADLRAIPTPNVIAGYKTLEKTFSQEFTFAGKSDTVNWVAGLFLYGDFYKVNYRLSHFSRQDTYAVAPYIDVTYKVTDALSVIGGLRYSYENKIFNYLRPNPITSPPTAAFENKVNFSSLSPRAVVKYELDRNQNIYASYSRGFKAGGYNVNATGLTSGTQAAAQPVKPETLDAFEVGYKLQRSIINFSTAAYYYNWKNIVVGRFTGSTTIQQNAAKAEIYGLEFDSSVRFTPELVLTMGGAYTHGRYKDFKDLSVNLPVNPADLNSPNTVLTSQDISGQRLLRAPDWTFNASVDYTVKTGSLGDITFTAGAYYSSEFATAVPRLSPVTGKQDLVSGGFTLFNASILWEFNQHFSAQAYVRNLTDKAYYSDMDATSTGVYAAYAEPRTFGLKLNYKY